MNYQASFFSNLSRRRSHPIKIRNLDAVTQRLCSSAGHLLEMEFEDLNIIADARRNQESPHSLVTENTIKNRYVNILPCNSHINSFSLTDTTRANRCCFQQTNTPAFLLVYYQASQIRTISMLLIFW